MSYAKQGVNRFQSTHSLRSATDIFSFDVAPALVSIHALLAECDFHFNGLCKIGAHLFQSTHSLRSATRYGGGGKVVHVVSIHALLAECDEPDCPQKRRTRLFQSTHSLRSATAPNLIHCYSTKQIILCANLPKKTVIARLLFLSIYLSIFYSQCITPIADLPGNSCELEVGAQAMFNSL